MYFNKKIYIVLLISVMFITQTGCNITFIGRTEMNRIEFIRAVGVDKCPHNDDLVRLTIATQSIKSSGSGGQQKDSETLFSEGKTVFDAVRNFWNHMDKRPFWGHLEYVIIGEEAAKQGIFKYIDFFSRDPEVRLNLKVFLAKDQSAEDTIKKVSIEDKFVFERLEGIAENQWGQSVSNAVELLEAMYILDNKSLSLYLPFIRVGDYTDHGENHDEVRDLIMGGFGIFNKDKLSGYLDDRMGRGLNWMRNKVNSGVIIVKSPQGYNISLEIIDSKTNFKPKIINKQLTVTINVQMTSNVAEISSSENIFNGETIKYLESGQEQIIKDEIVSVINYGKNKGLEFFGTAYAVQHKYPIIWEDLYSKNWKESFETIKYDVIVNSKINRTYNIREPRLKEAGED